jgi:protein-tyrosine-phosphatase/catechol 2,3-dioxygenase-like lactoylglutathione lyase family enzyme/DNA-binding transcriptional ArsR family regulator
MMGVPPTAPPEILGLLADPLRWELLGELGRSDRRVGELVQLLGKPQNLVSYHLAGLRRAGIVRARRSSADGRDVYYCADLLRCRELLAEAGVSLHPGAALTSAPPPAEGFRRGRSRLLFLCTGNSARSQMAEALVEHRSAGAVQARSAGSHPKPLHPNAVRVMAERGVDISEHSTKSLTRFTRNRFERVITLCDKVREVCPEFPGAPTTAHWSIPDPASAGDTDAATYDAFQEVADEIEGRVTLLLADLHDRPWKGPPVPDADTVNVRYLVEDPQASVEFYTRHFGFTVGISSPAFADVTRGNLRILLSGPMSSAGRAMVDGERPTPGGWNRIHLIVDDIEREVARLTEEGVTFRNEIVTGPGGAQALAVDPSGNLVELFQPAAGF